MYPKLIRDLSIAPVAVAVDANLQRLRGGTPEDVDFQLQLELDRGPLADDRREREERVLAFALRNVDLHGWTATLSEDGSSVRLAGGSVTLDIAVGAPAQRFLAHAGEAAGDGRAVARWN